MAGAHTGGWCVWQAHIAVAAATGRRTWRWQVEWQLPLPRKDFTPSLIFCPFNLELIILCIAMRLISFVPPWKNEMPIREFVSGAAVLTICATRSDCATSH